MERLHTRKSRIRNESYPQWITVYTFRNVAWNDAHAFDGERAWGARVLIGGRRRDWWSSEKRIRKHIHLRRVPYLQHHVLYCGRWVLVLSDVLWNLNAWIPFHHYLLQSPLTRLDQQVYSALKRTTCHCVQYCIGGLDILLDDDHRLHLHNSDILLHSVRHVWLWRECLRFRHCRWKQLH